MEADGPDGAWEAASALSSFRSHQDPAHREPHAGAAHVVSAARSFRVPLAALVAGVNAYG